MQGEVLEKKNTFRNVLIAAVILLIIALALTSRKNAGLKTDLNISKQNEKALSDSVRVSKNKVGDLEYSKNILVADKDNLEKLNKELYDEYKKENGKVSELTKYVVEIKNNPKDTIRINNNLINYPDGSRGLDWTYNKVYDAENSRTIKGVSNFKINFGSATFEVIPLETKITEDKIKFNVIQGLRETKNGDVEMFVRSDYPDFSVTDLNSVIINPKTHPVLNKFTTKAKQKRFGLGVFAGYGLYVDNFNTTAGLGIQLGVGLNYSLINF